MEFIPQIRLLEGLNHFDFGCAPEIPLAFFGKPETEDLLQDEISQTECLVHHYRKLGISLFYEKSPQARLSQVESENPGSLLNNTAIFLLSEKELIEQLNATGHKLSEREQHPWGETCLNFDSAGLACYFRHNKLSALSFSQKAL